MLKAWCPENPNHKHFITSVLVLEQWKVSEDGNYQEEWGPIQTVLHGPSKDYR